MAPVAIWRKNPGIVMGRIEVEVVEESLGDRLDVVVYQKEQARAGREDEQSFGGFEDRNGAEAKAGTFKSGCHGCNLDPPAARRQGTSLVLAAPLGGG